MILKLYIENELVDLFDDENVSLNSSIADTDDITKINSDYTKTFTVPASANNNRIFKHYYNADIDNTFDARTKKSARIELDGFPFRTGKIRLDKVAMKDNEPSSYTINFWGSLINFKDLLGDDYLTDLDYTDYNHAFDSATIKQGLVDGLFDRDVIYTIFSNQRQYLYDDDPSNNTNTNLLANIAYNGLGRGVNWASLRPSIRLKVLIDLISAKYDIVFSDDFFNRIEFTELYMLANAKNSDSEFVYSIKQIDWTGGDTTFMNLATNTATFGLQYTSSTVYNKWYHTILIQPDLASIFMRYTLITYVNGEVYSEEEMFGQNTKQISFQALPYEAVGTYTLSYDIKAPFGFTYTSLLVNNLFVYLFALVPPAVYSYSNTANSYTFSGNFDFNLYMPKLKVSEFLKGLFSMFKLVAIPDENGVIYVNCLSDYYKEGKVYDITKYTHTDTHDVSRGKVLNQINFLYEKPTTILNKKFEEVTGIAYGDEVTVLKDVDGKVLDGEKLEVKLPFENVLFERLPNSNIQYGYTVNDKQEPNQTKPIIYYNNNIELSGTKLSFVNQDSTASKLDTNLNTPAHSLGLTNPNFSILWGLEYSTWDYVAIQNTLYMNYWNDYITSIFNIKKRLFKFQAKLPISLLTRLKLNDVLFIKDRYYRINDFSVNLLNGDTTLNLLNTFETNFGLFQPKETVINLNYKAQTTNVYVTNGSVMNIVLEDLGYGTSWATVLQSGSYLVITVTENITDLNRFLFINVDNGDGKTFQIYLNQKNKVVSFDSTENTFDSTILTFDAE